MADILKLITAKDRVEFSENYTYDREFVTAPLFNTKKTDNFKVEVARLVEGANLPVMAQFHALDAEARIGDRANYSKMEYEKLLIKEKLNQTERIAVLLGNRPTDEEVVDFIYDDMANLTARVLTRAELANNQVLATGQLHIEENNYVTSVDYGYPSANNTAFTGWSDPEHDIVADLNAIIAKAKAKGKKITRALTSGKIVGYMVANKGLKGFFEKAGVLLTEQRLLQWVYDNFGIAFVTNDEVYKTSANDKTTHRFFPENKISFFGGNGYIGEGLYGETPEELMLNGVVSKGNVAITQWQANDPAAIWTKASAIYLPVIADIEGLFIATVAK